ncbi:hypothetical protein UlMin_025705 [Ulmus minor]
MEEGDELSPIDAASEPAISNPKPELAGKPSNGREEGELSSDDDNGNRVRSVSQSTSTDTTPAGPNPIAPANKCNPQLQVGKGVSGYNSAGSVDIQSRAPIQSSAQKSIDKNRIPSKPPAPGLCAPVGATSNLVISFSDDDSDSDSEEQIKGKAFETKSNVTGLVGNQKPPASSLPKQKLNHHTATVVPKRSSSLNPRFTPPVVKNRGFNSRGTGTSSVDQGYRVRNFNSLNKNQANRERGFDQGMGLNNSKLQDLRQQIALRENELKLKSSQLSKEVASFRDDSAMSLHSDATRKLGASYAESVLRELKEPEKKRAKVIGSYSTQLNSVSPVEVPVGKSTLQLKETAMENNDMQEKFKFDHGQKASSVGISESRIVKWQKQKDKQVAGVSENIPVGVKDGAKAITTCIQSDGSKQMYSSSVSNPATSPANINSIVLPNNLNNVELNAARTSHHQPSSLLNKATPGKNLVRDNHPDGLSSDRIPEPTFNNIHQESLNNESLWNCVSNANVSGDSNMSLQSLVEMEESLDRDLEEAQEHRRSCEIEERNALKAYRKAQRALVEANARCTDLYHKRELYSAHLRSFIIDNSNLLCSTRQNEQVGIGMDYSNNMSQNMHLIPIPSHQLQPHYGGYPLGFDSNSQYLHNAPVQTSDRHLTGQNAGSEPCSEPDASTSEPLSRRVKSTVNGASSPFIDPNISVDEDDDTFSFEHETVPPSIEHHKKDNNFEDGNEDVNKESSRKLNVDSAQDSFLLEARLRSKLFAKIGAKNLSKHGDSFYDIHTPEEQGTENDVSSGRTQTSSGPERQERGNSEAPVEIQHGCLAGNNGLNSDSAANTLDKGASIKECSQLLISEISSPNILRSAFGHLKVMFPSTSKEWQAGNRHDHSSDIYNEKGACVKSDKIQWSNTNADSMHETVAEIFTTDIGSYASNAAVDPIWPLCMYELRGKCNNDECPWQHVRDNINENMNQNQHDSSDSNVKVPKYCGVTMPPAYIVGIDTLRADLQSYDSALVWRNGQCWQKCFSLSLALSSLFQKDFPGNECLCDGRIEVHGNRSRQTSYFLSRYGGVNQLKESLADKDHVLETAILIFNQEVDRFEGFKKALPMLSRALEADPNSVILWIFYLLIYYSNINSVGKDDMFSYAVKYNDGSFELWLMYINSRMHIDDRLIAYDAALSALCRHASASDCDGNASACILDLFLQMIDCLCMSGNVEKAIQKIFELSADTVSNEPASLLHFDIPKCLTISDKCIFWVCCVYLVIYKKLPGPVTKQFECEKEPLEIEWSCIHLTDDEKQRAIKLFEKGVDDVDSFMKTEPMMSDTSLRSVHFLAINHIRCMAALDDSEHVRNLLDKYVELYPSCLELILMSARVKKRDFGDLSFVGFEETLGNWPKEVPGIQCIWYEYAECAFQNGRRELGKELMERWFHSVGKVHFQENGMENAKADGLLESASNSILETPLDQIDLMFGYLNLSLYKLLQNDHIEARVAVDKALKAAIPKYLKYCVREHAMFSLTDESLLKENASVSGIKSILERYIGDTRTFGDNRTFSCPEPLPRKFVDKIKKPRVRQLVTNLFTPVSPDFSLINLVLEVWHGPSLVFEQFSDPKHLVDFVEVILGICPSNYELAISVCKLLSSRKNSTDAASSSMLFWAGSNLVSAIFHAVPIPPEYVWAEAASVLSNIKGGEIISERFYRRALSVYPFSVKLWKSFHIFSMTTGKGDNIVEAAKEKGIDLVLC